ncbi:MAG: hypothetical protein QW744_03155 [Candidatus Bathyarchaeia archaeon]
MTYKLENGKFFEAIFVIAFSVFILVFFYALISMNGLVLGNDPAVHLEKAQIFLRTGKIPLENLGWAPPLYSIMLAAFIAFTGAGSIEQMIFLVKAAAVIIDWLLVLSVYLIGAKFFSKKIGAAAAILLLMCVPMYEVNLWGGYTTVLGLAFMVLLFSYLPSAKDTGHVMITFLAGFSLVLSHQLTTFVVALVLPPILLFLLVKSRGTYFKALVALVLGGGLAFFLYYFKATIAYVDVIIEHVFLTQKAYAYQIPYTSLNAFMMNFGFILVLALAGIFLALLKLRAEKQPALFLILFLSFLVPLILSQSHLFGLYLPFQWFIYYLTPPMAILAAVSLTFIIDRTAGFYRRYKQKWKKIQLQSVMLALIILASLTFMFRAGVVYGKIMEASVYYSTTDLKAYDAGVWLRSNFPEEAAVVVTEVPGFWFQLFSGKQVIAQTSPTVERNVVAEAVLDLTYEVEHPLTLVRVYDMTKGDVSDENYVSINHVWYMVSYSAADGNFIGYSVNGVEKRPRLSDFNRETVFENTSSLKKLAIRYFNDEISIMQTILIQNDRYPINVIWAVSPLKSSVSNVSLYLSTFFDLRFSLEKAYVPGVLNWENPWSRPTYIHGNEWAVVNFSRSTLTDNYLSFYDEKNEVIFALSFSELPDWGNVGVLASNQIDAVRFQYNFDRINVNQTASFQYQVLTFSKNSYPEFVQLSEFKNLFAAKHTAPFEVKSRDYSDFIKEKNIRFIVYDRNQLDTKIIRSRRLEMIYSNDRYVIFKIKS